jgi:hypothetical protein
MAAGLLLLPAQRSAPLSLPAMPNNSHVAGGAVQALLRGRGCCQLGRRQDVVDTAQPGSD